MPVCGSQKTQHHKRTSGSSKNPAAAFGGCASALPTASACRRGFGGSPMGIRVDGRGQGSPQAWLWPECAVPRSPSGQQATPRPPSDFLSIGPSWPLLSASSTSSGPSLAKSQTGGAPASYVVSSLPPIFLCPQSPSAGECLLCPPSVLRSWSAQCQALPCIWLLSLNTRPLQEQCIMNTVSGPLEEQTHGIMNIQ